MLILFGFSLTGVCQGIGGQDLGTGYLEDEGTSLWDEGGFMDDTGENDGQYLEEDEVRAQEAAALRAMKEDPSIDIVKALEQDRALLDDNIIYGVGTGVTIGGWLALLYGNNARQNVQYVSLGIISGVILGVLLGTKSLYQSALDPYETMPIEGYQPKQTPLNSSENMLARLDFQIRF